MLRTVQQQVIKELEEVPLEAQEMILKFIRFFKNEILVSAKKRGVRKKTNALLDMDKIAIDTGIPDLADQHDHYLYGGPNKMRASEYYIEKAGTEKD